MKNKKLWLKLGLLVFAIFWFGLSFSYAVNFNLNVEWIKALSKDAIKENMMNIHFADNWNDFWGFFYFSNGSGEEIEWSYGIYLSGENKPYFECGKQIRWFYYNAERWERLWPLDDQTWKNIPWISGLNTSWWIYTLCGRPWYVDALKKCEEGKYPNNSSNLPYDECVEKVKNDFPSDGFGYYGNINQTYSWQEFNLTVGVDYNVQNVKFISIKSNPSDKKPLKPTFIRINNKYPVGFVYDYNGWVGLAWCRFVNVGSNSMKNLMGEINGDLLKVFKPTNTGIKYEWNQSVICTGVISTEDTLVKVLVEWIVWLDNHGTWTKFWSLGNTTDAKMQYFGTKTASNVALMNYAAKKAESLCRWKWETRNFPGINNNTKEKTICLSGLTVSAENAGLARQYGKTLIVKNWDVTIKPDDESTPGYYDIFIDGGNLIINESDAGKYVIETDGFVSVNNVGITGFNVYSYLRERSYSGFSECFTGANCIEYEWENGEIHENCGYQDLACSMFDINGDGDINSADQLYIVSLNVVNDLGHWDGDDLVLDQNFSSMASVIKWNFIVNWSVIWTWGSVGGKLDNKYFIYGKFTTKNSISELENVFSWRCNNWFGTDGIFCPKFEWNPYRNAAVVVIDQNYSSPLLGS